MFSKNQITFGLIFLLCFAVIMIFLYRKDLKTYASKQYQGVYKLVVFVVAVLLGFWLFVKFVPK